MKTWKLSPSDLTFLLNECPRCFYLKVVYNLRRPYSPFPSIFTRIDRLMKVYFQDKPSEDLTPQLPNGVVKMGDRLVNSEPISLSGHTSSCYISGKFDCLVEFADGTYGVVDFKTSEAKAENVPFYSRQLHAYAYALEHPAPKGLYISPISRLGLLSVEPVHMDKLHLGRIAYLGDVTWQECPKSYPDFLDFLDQVLTILELPLPPESGSTCEYCAYRQGARSHGW